MKLTALIQDLSDARIVGPDDIDVRAVRDDSRQVEVGDVFVAVRGMRADGHDFVAQVVRAGAAAVVVERDMGVDVTQVIVADAGEALGRLAARARGRAIDRMALVGITGTNGKTTTTFLVESMLAAADARPGVIGTVSYRYGGDTYPAPYTTPTPLVLHDVLADMAAAHTTHAVLEVSSAALAMDRMAGMRFRVGAFTNLTQDHLEVHQTMEAYLAAKARLFAHYLADDGIAVINVDDPAAPDMIAAAGGHAILTVSAEDGGSADVQVLEAASTVEGITATVATPRGFVEIRSEALLGDYNVANIAMTVAIGEALGLPHEAIARGIEDMSGVPGRVERVPNDHGLDILVDYAHTPDALRNVLSALRPLTRGRLICVFGCGGDRDPSKRPKMGAAVSELADLAVVTSDNPRTEDPQSIVDMILPAVPEPFFVDTDRRTAIRAAVAEAVPGDIVVIAGKGHEDYQILGTEKIHFDDREEAAEAARLRQGFPIEHIAEATGAEILVRGGRDELNRVVIDGRHAAPGDLYVAIRGERFDGHDFCAQAIAGGASALLVARDVRAELAGGSAGETVLLHPDPRAALGAIARMHRRRWGKRGLVGVTGSAGKTTTKELLAAALGAAGRVHKATGSNNNETGVPLTVLGLRPFHDFAVVEMGMRGLGQIAELCEIAEPDVGLVINAGTAHIGLLGSTDAIAAAKSEIFASLPPHGCAVVPAGDPRLRERAASAPRVLTFGPEADADVRLASYRAVGLAGADLTLRIGSVEYGARIPLPGRHNALNAAAAVAAAIAAGASAELAVRGLEDVRPAPLRGHISSIAGRHILVDCYNANPASTGAALQTLAELAAGHRAVAVLGDMLELGDEAARAHREAGRRAAALDISIVAVGEHAADVVDGAGRGEIASDPVDAARRVVASTGAGDWVLVKASRAMRLERVLAALEEIG